MLKGLQTLRGIASFLRTTSGRTSWCLLSPATYSSERLLRRAFGLLTMSGSKPNVVFVLGPPGSGKGTQCQKIVEVRRGRPGYVRGTSTGHDIPSVLSRSVSSLILVAIDN
ncbi:UMP-CMP kinase 2-like isoform X1 [Ixodes scapularis]